MRLVFFGPPGAGKGTMAALIQERLRVAHLSSGDLLREAVRRGDSIGQEVSRLMQVGLLVPDALVTGLVLQRLDEWTGDRDFVLDGFPRTVDQAQALDQALTEKGQGPIDLAIDFELSPSTMVTRLAGRRVCGHCGTNYHLVTMPPKRKGLCDRCGAPLQARADDQPDTILKRLSVYREDTMPVLVYYRKQGKLRTVSGELQIEDQYQALLQVLPQE